jgi:hypothetical protein
MELVGLAPHRISTVQQPAVGILLDGKRVHTLQLGLSIFFEITGLVAGISHGRLAAVHAGRGHVGVALTIHEIEVLTKRTHLELPGHAGLRRGFRLLPASHYPDEPQSHPSGGQVPAAELMGAGFASAGHPAGQPASAFPDVNLTDAGAEHPSAQPGPGHGSASWWEKTQAGPARHAAPGDPR